MTEPVLLSTDYTVVIDTNALSYDFANKLCAYCTGFIDDEDNGLEMSDLYYLEQGIEDDESPRGRVADEKNSFYGFVGQRQQQDDNSGMIFSPCSIWLSQNYGRNEDGEVAKLTEENYDEYHFAAPASVGIFFDVEPTAEHIQTIKTRAVSFFEKVWPKLKEGSEKVTVEGFSLITNTKYGDRKTL